MLLESVSEFDKTKALLWQWLKSNVIVKKALTKGALSVYEKKFKFIAGWKIEIAQESQLYDFEILIDRQFPYSAIRVAFKSQDNYLKWPHVEPEGLLCLPERPPPSCSLVDSVQATLSDSLDLIRLCQDGSYVDAEFRKEFLSYWDRLANGSPVRSLLDINNPAIRRIAVWHGRSYTVVGETEAQVASWLKNKGKEGAANIVPGAFGFLKQPPRAPFPDTPSQLCKFLQAQCPDVLSTASSLSIKSASMIILGAESETGKGLIAFSLSLPNLRGFRKNTSFSSKQKFYIWKTRSQLGRHGITRYDPEWVHGRGVNNAIPHLQSAAVMVFGCGSLGSQVAARLAQAGVGRIMLVDPDILSPANVGRHALGIDSTGKAKASTLAETLKLRFPHLKNIEGHDTSWQELHAKKPSLFEDASLIVSCLGDWPSDGQLGEWQSTNNYAKPIIYGWLDEQGTAAHAVVLTEQAPTLNCILNPDGSMRSPESTWKNGGHLQSEPACGTLFQPYGPIDVAHAEALVSRLCIDVLTGEASLPTHRVYAGTTEHLIGNGGEWSEDHLKYRPSGFEGAFEYEKPIPICSECLICLKNQ